MSGNSSANMMAEPSISISACPTVPFGPSMRMRSAEHFIEIDRAISPLDDQVRGYAVIAIGNCFHYHDCTSLLTVSLKKLPDNTASVKSFSFHRLRERLSRSFMASGIVRKSPTICRMDSL
jgi:hypothetical protein